VPTPEHQSGLIGDDWGIVMDVTTTPSATSTTTTATTSDDDRSASSSTFLPDDDTDPRYWKSIAAFDEDGHISTLSLGGQRLRKLPSDASVFLLAAPALWKRVVTVDLANTDLPVPFLCQVLQQIAATQQQQQQTPSTSTSVVWSSRLTQLYLGGNGLGGGGGGNSNCKSGLAEIMPHLTTAIANTLQVLDLRFNDLGPADASLLGQFLQEEKCRCEKLYLEGNVLGDAGAQYLANGCGANSNNSLRELYLGANGIGPVGAAALALGLVGNPAGGSRLEKLYLEGNCIGPEGARSFIDVLENAKKNAANVALQKLYVDNNNIGKKEAVRLGHALGQVTVIGETNLYQEDGDE
jgi:Leucine Rich repeat